MKLSKAQALAVRELLNAERALVEGKWSDVCAAAVRLTNLAAERAAK